MDEDGDEKKDMRRMIKNDELPVIYIITPTYSRGAQKADLTRLSHTLLLVPRIHWILIEDSPFKTELVTNFIANLNHFIIPRMRGKMILRRDTIMKSQSDTSFHSTQNPYSSSSNSYSLFDLKITHLNTETPADLKIKAREPNWLKPRGVNQRNLGLKWLRNHLQHSQKLNNKELHEQQDVETSNNYNNNHNFEGDSSQRQDVGEGIAEERMAEERMAEEGIAEEGIAGVRSKNNGNVASSKRGVVFFADDDNTYDLRLFEEMRNTSKVSIWPVALVGGLKIERPLIKEGRVVGFNSVWSPQRPYPVDMAGFAINVHLLLNHPDASFSYDVPRGFQESHILSQLISGWSQLEPKAANCTQVLVWHTRTVKPSFHREVKLDAPSDLNMEF